MKYQRCWGNWSAFWLYSGPQTCTCMVAAAFSWHHVSKRRSFIFFEHQYSFFTNKFPENWTRDPSQSSVASEFGHVLFGLWASCSNVVWYPLQLVPSWACRMGCGNCRRWCCIYRHWICAAGKQTGFNFMGPLDPVKDNLSHWSDLIYSILPVVEKWYFLTQWPTPGASST